MSKFDPLWYRIANNGSDRLSLSFEEMERIAGVPVDHSFLSYKKELEAFGYKVQKISLKEKTVLFTRLEKQPTQIRYLSASDSRSAVGEIYVQSWRHAYRDILPQTYLDALEPKCWEKNADIPGWKTMLCIQGDRYVGTGCFSKSRDDRFQGSGEVISLYLLPAYIGKGYGGRLLCTMLEEMRRAGFPEVFLWVLEENTAARGFYEHYRFSLAEERETCVIGGKELYSVRYVYRYEQ